MPQFPTPDDGRYHRLKLANVLAAIERCEPDADTPEAARQARYRQRADLIWQAAYHAVALGYPVGIGTDKAEPQWPVIYIDLPEETPGEADGTQVSWHVAEYPRAWDGHTTEQKYARCRAYTAAHWQPLPTGEGQ